MEAQITIEIRRGAKLIDNKVFPLDREILFGRLDSADLHLDAREISRRHGILTGTEQGYFIRDLSLNGISAGSDSKNSLIPWNTHLEVGPFTLIPSLHCGEDINTPRLEHGALRRNVLKKLVDQISLEVIRAAGDGLRPRVESTLDRLLFEAGLADPGDRRKLKVALADEALGLGPLESLLADDTVSEIMVVAPDTVYVERNGCLELTDRVFSSADSVRTVIERIVTPLGRRIDESSPLVDARLADGSRVNAIIPPLALKGPTLTIRKFAKTALRMDDLIGFGTLTPPMAALLRSAVRARRNIVISGGTGSGKTTLLNVLSSLIPEGERIVTIEDAAELRLCQPHVVSLETRPANAEGRGEITIRDLVRNALRMRPDRIVVGECRGGEALDMLQAMNTGHDGSLTTTHANSPPEALLRLETLSLMSGVELPLRAIREQIAGAVHLILQQSRTADGRRRITAITELLGLDEEGHYRLHDLCVFRKTPGNETGNFVPTGRVASFESTDETAEGEP